MSKAKRGVALFFGALLLLTATTLYAAVELSYFDGQWDDNEDPSLFWGTESEGDNAGFYVWRSEQNLQVTNGQLDTSQATRISSFIVNPDGSCNPFNSHDYLYNDDDASGIQDRYYYYLESYNCGSGTVFYGANGNATGPGLELTNPDAPQVTPTNTRTPSPTATTASNPSATPTATGNGSNPTATATPPPPAATQTVTVPAAATTTTTGSASATSTRTVVASNTPVVPPPAGASSTPITQPATQPQATLPQPTRASGVATTIPVQPSPPSQNDSATSGQSGQGGQAGQAGQAGQGQPSSAPSATVAIALNSDNPAPGGTSGDGGAMSAQPQAATPTVVTLLGAAPTTPMENETLFATESSNDPIDRLIQGLIALLLLGVVALIGFMGWTYVRP